MIDEKYWNLPVVKVLCVVFCNEKKTMYNSNERRIRERREEIACNKERKKTKLLVVV